MQKVKISNLTFYKRSETIYLENLSNIDIDEISSSIDKFYNLKEVNFGTNSLEKSDMQKLESRYPSIKFSANVVIDVYGMKVKDNVTYLDLSNVKIDDNLVKVLNNFPNLIQVNLSNQVMTVDEQLELSKIFPKIKFKFTIAIEGKYYDSFAEELNLSNSKLKLEEVEKLIKLFPDLKKVDLSDSALTNEECDSLRKKFPDIQIDWKVYLGKWSLRTDAVAFSVLIVYFDYQRMTSKDIEVLKYCTKLKALDLGHQAITDISVLGDYLPDLRILILADNKIEDISPIAKMKHLHYLELFINPISDLSPLRENKELVDLNVANLFKVRDVSPILELPMLERLMVNNLGPSWDEINKLYQAYPNAHITRTGNQSTHDGWRSHPRYFQMIDMFHNNYYGDEFSKYDKD